MLIFQPHLPHIITNSMRPLHDLSHSKIMHYRKLTPWAVSEKKWDTKEDEGKSMMQKDEGKSTVHALFVLWYATKRADIPQLG